MSNATYETEAKRLAKAIDVAVDAFEKFPPEAFNTSHLNHFIKVYLDWKNRLFNCEDKFKNLRSLKYSVEDVFTYFKRVRGTLWSISGSRYKICNWGINGRIR